MANWYSCLIEIALDDPEYGKVVEEVNRARQEGQLRNSRTKFKFDRCGLDREMLRVSLKFKDVKIATELKLKLGDHFK